MKFNAQRICCEQGKEKSSRKIKEKRNFHRPDSNENFSRKAFCAKSLMMFRIFKDLALASQIYKNRDVICVIKLRLAVMIFSFSFP